VHPAHIGKHSRHDTGCQRPDTDHASNSHVSHCRPASAGFALAALLSVATVAGPPFRTDYPEPMDSQHWEMDLFPLGTYDDGATTAILPDYEVNCGAMPN
jgi:hypothetical protein